MENFPYSVNEIYIKLKDNKCCCEISDHTGYHFYRCFKPIKGTIEGIGFCGIHLRKIRRWRKEMLL